MNKLPRYSVELTHERYGRCGVASWAFSTDELPVEQTRKIRELGGTVRSIGDWPESSVWGAELPGGPRVSPNAIGWTGARS